MTPIRFLLRSLRFHARGHLAAAAGVAVGAAVLVGALLVGDSLRGSLRDRVTGQLGRVDHLVTGSRFFRADLATDLGPDAVPAVVARGSLTAGDARVAGVTVHGLGDFAVVGPSDGDTLVGPAVLDRLSARPVAAQIGQASDLPRESPLGNRDAAAVVSRFDLPDPRVAPPAFARFSLQPTTDAPRNAFVPLARLQAQLDQPGRANALLLHGGSRDEWQRKLNAALTLDDWGLRVVTPESETAELFRRLDRNGDGVLQPRETRQRVAEAWLQAADRDGNGDLTRDEALAAFRTRGTVRVESRRVLIEPAVERAIDAAATAVGLRAAPTLVYLANRIKVGDAEVPYSVVAGLDPLAAAPLGPWLPPGSPPLAVDEVVLLDYPGSPFAAAKPGDRVEVSYFQPELEGQVVESLTVLKLRARVPLAGVTADPDLAPPFPGITDKLSLRDWNPPFPYDNARVKPADEAYWNRYRGAPKAVVSPETGRKLFGSRFGAATSVRLAPPAGVSPDAAGRAFAAKLLATLNPEAGGFTVEPVRERALTAGRGGNDFGVLFLAFSCVLIAAALVLVVLLTRLSLERRAGDLGLMLATGFAPRQLGGLLLAEGVAVALAGVLLGVPLAFGYAALMLKLLAAMWPGGDAAATLRLHATPASVAIGVTAMLFLSAVATLFSLRRFVRIAPIQLLKGEGELSTAPAKLPGRPWVAMLAAVAGVAMLAAGPFVQEHEAQAGLFFGAGSALLLALLLFARRWLRFPLDRPLTPALSMLPAWLAVRNLSRFPGRNLLTVTLLALAAFLLVAVEAFRKAPAADFATKVGGSGGFALIAESDLPLFRDPSTPEGRDELRDLLTKAYQRDPATQAAKLAAAERLLTDTEVIPLRLRAGDDASCLNLMQPTRPRVVGVPRRLRDRGGFGADWSRLAGPGTPAFGESSTVQWMLHTAVGGTVEVPDDRGATAPLTIAALLADSPFQSELLIAEEQFTRLFPSVEGYRVLLIAPPPGREAEAAKLFETAYAARGLAVEPTRDRVARYQAVENLYLSTFQLLGGFGLLLGTAGLAVVLLRSVWDRRAELALCRAVGFRDAALGRTVFAETAALLAVGLLAGGGAALAAAVPHWRASGAGEAGRLAGLLGLVAAAGIVAGAVAVRAALRVPLVPALRRE